MKLFEISYRQEPNTNKINKAIRYAESDRHAAYQWRSANPKYPVQIVGIKRL